MDPLPKLGIIACGAGGLTTGLDFNRRFGEVAKIFAPPEHPGYSIKARQQEDIEVYMALEGRFKVDIEIDLGRFVKFCDWIFVISTASGHYDIMRSLVPYKALLNNTILVWVTGNGTGLVAHENLEPLNTIETVRLQYTCRVENPLKGELRIRLNGFKRRVVATSYHKLDENTRATFDDIIGMPSDFESAPSFLDILFVAKHGYIHPPTMLRNRRAIENGWPLFFYRHLMTIDVCQEMLNAWDQLCNLARTLHLKEPEHPVETFNKDYGTNYDSSLEGLWSFVNKCEALNRKPVLPASMRDRQLSQEMGFICPLWVSMARAVGVDLSVVEGWINEACEVNGVDYWTIGRTLAYYDLPENASTVDIRSRFGIFPKG